MNDGKIIIKKENVVCDYKNNKLLIYNEDDYINTIDIVHSIYYRENDEYKIIFNFKENTQIIHLKKDNLEFSQELTGNIIIMNNIINIKYNSSLESKEIIIQLL